MSRYILVAKENKVLDADYSVQKLRADNLNTSFRAVIPKVRLKDYGVYKLADVPRPEVADGFEVVFGGPKLIGGVWTKTWAEVPLSAEALTSRAIEAARVEVREGTFYQTIKDMTPEQMVAHVEKQITDLDSAKVVIGQLAAMASVFMKRMG